MDYWKAINNVIIYIDDNIQENIELKNIANVAGYSVHHFSRLFKAEIGISVKDYVRRRKMVFALLDSDEKDMLGIAMDYGYETQTGFIKAFKKIYGFTPKNYIEQVLCASNNKSKIMTYRKIGGQKIMKLECIGDNTIEKILPIADKVYNLTKNSDGKYTYEFWREKFLEHPELMIYAQEKDSIIGFMFGCVDNDAVTLSYDWVDKKYKNTEIKSELLSSFECQVKSIGHDAIYLGVSSADEKFYETNGYFGRLLVQSKVDTVDELKSIASDKCVCANVYEGAINQVYFKVDTLCKDELIKNFTKEFPECNTIMVYGKKLVNG